MKNKNLTPILLIFIITNTALFATQEQETIFDNMSLRGYVKGLPGMRLNKDFANPEFDNLIHHRLNFRWNISGSFRFVAEGRNRLFYNSLFEDFPLFAETLDQDDGLLDLSWVYMDEGAWIGQSEIDRLYLDYTFNNWQFRAGRQRINWGINLVSNPNDLFNTYSFFDFDYEERPGTDAVRAQYHLGFASRLEMAYSPAKESKNSVAALLYTTNYKGYDLQALGGYYQNRSAVGLGWAGNIGGAGFKGEATWFYDLEKTHGERQSNLVAATGVDYMFGTGTFAVLEFLYNGGFEPFHQIALLMEQPLTPDNIMFSEYAITTSLQHPFTPIFSGTMAVMALPDQDSFFISPQASWSLITNLDLDILSQIFVGGDESLFQEAGSAWYLSLKYSF